MILTLDRISSSTRDAHKPWGVAVNTTSTCPASSFILSSMHSSSTFYTYSGKGTRISVRCSFWNHTTNLYVIPLEQKPCQLPSRVSCGTDNPTLIILSLLIHIYNYNVIIFLRIFIIVTFPLKEKLVLRFLCAVFPYLPLDFHNYTL